MSELLEQLCEEMHDRYEKAATGAGWETNPKSRKPWSGVPEANKAAMRAAIGPIADRIAELEAVEGALTERLERRLQDVRNRNKRIAELEAAMREAASKRYFNAALQVLAEAMGEQE